MANPNEKNVLWRILHLLRLNCQLIFVFDGPGRPHKRGNAPKEMDPKETKLLKEMLNHFGIPIHIAPAEAEAECAELQKLGIVDAVWTDDGDALMFGAETVIRFCFQPESNRHAGINKTKSKKDIDKVRIYKSKAITEKYPGLDRKGLVLFAVLCGGDYNQAGLPGCGPERALKAASKGLGTILCGVSANGLPAWRQRLFKFFAENHHDIAIPTHFPNPNHVNLYNKPLVSSAITLQGLRRQLGAPVMLEERALWNFLGACFNLWAQDYVDQIIPILLVRSLAQTSPGQEASHAVYQLEQVSRGASGRSTVSFGLCALASLATLNTNLWLKETGQDKNKQPYNPPSRVICHNILDCIVEHAVPGVIKARGQLSSEKTKPNSNPKGIIGSTSVPPLSGKKRGRPRKNPVEDTADSTPTSKRMKQTPETSSENNVVPRPPARVEFKSPFNGHDLDSDLDEAGRRPLLPKSPNSVRQARLDHFSSKEVLGHGSSSLAKTPVPRGYAPTVSSDERSEVIDLT